MESKSLIRVRLRNALLLCVTIAAISLLLVVGGLRLAVDANETDPTRLVPIRHEQGGAVRIVGDVVYTNPFFTTGVAEPVVILEDQAGFVDRDESFLLPLESQVLGRITSDFDRSPFSYSLHLPAEPQGTYRDVDNDGWREKGIQIYAIAYWTNTFGDPYLEERDLFGGGWSTAYASTRVGDQAEKRNEIIGGKLLIYAPNDRQDFPTGFGSDKLLFTADDPTPRVPQGYTVVDLDTDPFIFDRSRNPIIDLIEPDQAALVDLSDFPYDVAFNRLVDILSKEYAFTEYKGVDWEGMRAEYLPRFQEAWTARDARQYRRALSDFAWSIPDGHISGPFLVDEFRRSTEGGLGLAIRNLDDGPILTSFVLEGGPAAQEGIQVGAEILTLDERVIDRAVEEATVWTAPFSTRHVEYLQKLRYAVRFPIGTRVGLTYRNPGTDTIQTANLQAVAESQSFEFSSSQHGLTGFELPVEFSQLEGGYGYAKITSFSDNKLLTIQLWERMIRQLNEAEAAALIIDMRQNLGGSGFLADQMAAYFFDEPHELGNTGRYDESQVDFYFDDDRVDRFFLPPPDLRYAGQVVVLVGPDCNSACEFFSYDLTIDRRATIVGHYPTAGLGGSISRLRMPLGENFTYTAGRAVDRAGQIHIEGMGVAPDVRVPVTEEALLRQGDPVLEAAVEFLQETSR